MVLVDSISRLVPGVLGNADSLEEESFGNGKKDGKLEYSQYTKPEEVEGWKVPKKFFPETMTPRVLKLAKVWTELCRFVLMQLGSSTPYGVGFIFDRKIMAEADVESDEDAEGDDKLTWLMLNPFRDAPAASAIYTPSKDDDLRQLYASAIHEATHIADRIDYHDESFAVALTNNFAKCADGWRKIKTIVAGIRMTGSPALVPEDDE